MKTIEEYAIDLVASGAESVAEDDIDENSELASEDDLRAAIKLAIDIAHAIRDNPQAALALVGRKAAPPPEPLGYYVLIREHDLWNATWDGEVHPTREAAEEQVRLAHAAGFEAAATGLTPFPINTEVGADA